MGRGEDFSQFEIDFLVECFERGLGSKDIEEEVQDNLSIPRKARSIARIRKIYEADKVSYESKHQIPIPELAREEHRRDLAGTAGQILSFWEQHSFNNIDYYGFIIDDPQFEQVDAHLANGLLSHLKSESSAFSSMKDWRDLVNKDIPRDALSNLALIARRRTFQGACEICQAWQASETE